MKRQGLSNYLCWPTCSRNCSQSKTRFPIPVQIQIMTLRVPLSHARFPCHSCAIMLDTKHHKFCCAAEAQSRDPTWAFVIWGIINCSSLRTHCRGSSAGRLLKTIIFYIKFFKPVQWCYIYGKAVVNSCFTNYCTWFQKQLNICRR